MDTITKEARLEALSKLDADHKKAVKIAFADGYAAAIKTVLQQQKIITDIFQQIDLEGPRGLAVDKPTNEPEI